MKVLFITRKYPPSRGGMESFSYNLFKNIKSDKKVLKWGGSQKWLFFVMPYFAIRAVFMAWKVDVVHLGDMVLSPIGIFLRLFYSSKIIVVNIHGLDITYRNLFYQWYVKVFGKGFDRYFCNSNAVLKIATRMGFEPAEVIPMGINSLEWSDLRKKKDIDLQKYKDKKVLLTVGRLVKRKGVKWFLENVFKDLPEDYVYFIAGQGRDFNKVKNYIDLNKLQKRVFLFGRVSDKKLKQLYSRADVFVMPNIVTKNDIEGFGIVAIEAGSSGIPVVAARTEGIKDAIIDGKNGFLIESKDAEAFKTKIIELCQMKTEKLESMSIEIKRYNKQYDWGKIVPKYERIYHKLANNND